MPKKDDLCIYCKHYIPETDSMEAECKMENDINDAHYCDEYESKNSKE